MGSQVQGGQRDRLFQSVHRKTETQRHTKGTRHDKRRNIQQTEEFITHKHKKKKGETRETLAKDISSETIEWDRRTLLVVSPSRTWTS